MFAWLGMFWTTLARVCLFTAAVISLGPIQFQQEGSYLLLTWVRASLSTGLPGLKEKALLVTEILPVVRVSGLFPTTMLV